VYKKEEGDGKHVGDGKVVISADNGCGIGGMDDDQDWDGLDMVWWGIGSGVAMELALEVEVNGASGVEVRVTGPQSGEALAHCTEGVLYCVRANWLATGGSASIVVPLGKDLEEEDRVRNVCEGFIGAKGLAEGAPVEPSLVVGSGM
jgi:hypothetical protein